MKENDKRKKARKKERKKEKTKEQKSFSVSMIGKEEREKDKKQ